MAKETVNIRRKPVHKTTDQENLKPNKPEVYTSADIFKISKKVGPKYSTPVKNIRRTAKPTKPLGPKRLPLHAKKWTFDGNLHIPSLSFSSTLMIVSHIDDPVTFHFLPYLFHHEMKVNLQLISSTEVLTASHKHLLTSVSLSLKTANKKLIKDLTSTASAAHESRQALIQNAKELLDSKIQDAVYSVTHDDKDNKITENAVLSTQIEKFRTATAEGEAALKGLWEKWEGVTREIVGLGVEVLGVKAFERLDGDLRGEKGKVVAAAVGRWTEGKALQESVVTETEAKVQMVKGEGEKSIERLRRCDEVRFPLTTLIEVDCFSHSLHQYLFSDTRPFCL